MYFWLNIQVFSALPYAEALNNLILLLGRSSGFQVASTQKPCTKGVWLWSAPIKSALDGTAYNLLLLNTEGIDAYDQTGTYNTQIFSLEVLLPTIFSYNQMAGIYKAALDRLSLVTEMKPSRSSAEDVSLNNGVLFAREAGNLGEEV